MGKPVTDAISLLRTLTNRTDESAYTTATMLAMLIRGIDAGNLAGAFGATMDVLDLQYSFTLIDASDIDDTIYDDPTNLTMDGDLYLTDIGSAGSIETIPIDLNNPIQLLEVRANYTEGGGSISTVVFDVSPDKQDIADQSDTTWLVSESLATIAIDTLVDVSNFVWERFAFRITIPSGNAVKLHDVTVRAYIAKNLSGGMLNSAVYYAAGVHFDELSAEKAKLGFTAAAESAAEAAMRFYQRASGNYESGSAGGRIVDRTGGLKKKVDLSEVDSINTFSRYNSIRKKKPETRELYADWYAGFDADFGPVTEKVAPEDPRPFGEFGSIDTTRRNQVVYTNPDRSRLRYKHPDNETRVFYEEESDTLIYWNDGTPILWNDGQEIEWNA